MPKNDGDEVAYAQAGDMYFRSNTSAMRLTKRNSSQSETVSSDLAMSWPLRLLINIRYAAYLLKFSHHVDEYQDTTMPNTNLD